MVVDDYMANASDHLLTGGSRTGSMAEMTLPTDVSEIEPRHCKNKNFDVFFKSLTLRIEKFTRDWNADVTNRDKTVQVLNQ